MMFANNLTVLLALSTLLAQAKECPNIHKLNILPGFGWDALTNQDKIQLTRLTYTQCLKTSDKKYLIPDGFVATYVGGSTKPTVEIIDDQMSNFTAATTQSMRKSYDIWPNEYLPLYFSGSLEYYQMRRLQVEKKAFTVRAQIRRTLYNVSVSNKVILTNTVKKRISSAMRAISLNKMEVAENKIREVIKEYGTHCVQSVMLGLSLVKDDFLSYNLLYDGKISRNEILAQAENFVWEFMHTPNGESSSSSLENLYKNALLHTNVNSYGGSNWVKGVTSPQMWFRQIETMEAVDRTGMLLYELITTENFPNASPIQVAKVRQLMENAIRQYYTNNIRRGCMKQFASNFNFLANIDDRSCTFSSQKYRFFEIYKICNQDRGKDTFDACKQMYDMEANNYYCPPGTTPNLLYSESFIYKTPDRRDGTGFIAYNQCFQPNGQGYQFGGVYSDLLDNMHTKNESCPPKFYPFQLFDSSKAFLCIGSGHSTNLLHYAVPYLGLSTCKTKTLQCRYGGTGTLLTRYKNCPIYICLENPVVNNLQPPSLHGLSTLIIRDKDYTGYDDYGNVIDEIPEYSSDELFVNDSKWNLGSLAALSFVDTNVLNDTADGDKVSVVDVDESEVGVVIYIVCAVVVFIGVLLVYVGFVCFTRIASCWFGIVVGDKKSSRKAIKDVKEDVIKL